MRATLLTAQKMASQMVKDAETEKAEMLEKAESEIGARKAELEAELAAEAERLRLAKEESATFIANMRRLCDSELEFLNGVPDIQITAAESAEKAEEKVDEQVQSIESSVLASFDREQSAGEGAAAEEEPPAEAADAAEESAEAETPAQEAKDDEPEEDDDLTATRRIDFGDLKFGRNYRHEQ